MLVRDRTTLFVRLLITCVLMMGAAPGSAADTSSAQEQAQRQVEQPGNNAPFWRDVRSGDLDLYQTTQVRGIETNILVQSAGQTWRELRNGPIIGYGAWLLLVIPVLIGLFFWRKGSLKTRGKPAGRMVERFSAWDCVIHWTSAISFVILAVSGIVMLFGKYVLLPVFGYTFFSWLAILSKYLHNFVGPLFVICTALMIVTFISQNIPRAYDWVWVRKFGGLTSGEHVPSGKFNAGEKAWFWAGVVGLGLIVSASGLVLDFPNFAQGRDVMQQANVVHAVAALLFMAMSLGHIYLGTIGMEGAYDSMRTGYVDETWAKEHHEYWYNEVKGQSSVTGGAPLAAHASAMKEGWKL
jgi:formate dehydrogenase subunit gamma